MTTKPNEITAQVVKKVAHLARLELDEASIPKHVQTLGNIFDLIQQMDICDTKQISPMSSPFSKASTLLRQDEVTATDERKLLQKLAPAVASGLYLVPQVIE